MIMEIKALIFDDGSPPEYDIVMEVLQSSEVSFNFVDHTNSNWEEGRIGIWVATSPRSLRGQLAVELSLNDAKLIMYNPSKLKVDGIDIGHYVAEYNLANPNFADDARNELNRLARYGIGSDFSFD